MATISSGSLTITLEAGETYRIKSSGEAYVDIGGGSSVSYRLIGATSEKVIGNFSQETTITVRVVSGIVAYIKINANITGVAGIGAGGGKVYGDDGSFVTGTAVIPEFTANKSFRNQMGNGGFPRDKQGGAVQAVPMCIIPIYDDIAAGEKVVFGWFTRAGYNGTGSLSGAVWQVGLEFPGESDSFTPAYAIAEADNVMADTPYELLPVTTALTKTIGSSNADVQFLWTAPRAIKRGSILVMKMWCKNGFMRKTSNDIAGKNRIPFGSYIGEGFAYDANSTNYNNNTMALFTDGSITGMSQATRDALTNSMMNGNSGNVSILGSEYWHTGPDYMLKYTDRVAIGALGNSRNQKGGSTNATCYDQSYIFGYTGALFGRKFSILDLSGATGKFYDWVANPSFKAVHIRALQYVTHLHMCEWENDLTAFTAAEFPAKFDEFMSLPYWQGKVLIASDIPPVQPVAPANPPADYGVTEATTFTSTANRNVLNSLIWADTRFAKVLPVNNLLTSKTNRNKFRRPANARTVVGSAAPRGSFTITNAVWDSTGGGQITFTVSSDPTDSVFPNKYIDVASVVPTAFNTLWLVRSVTSTTIVVECLAASSIGTYTSGGTATTYDYVVTLSKGEFKPGDEQLNIGNANLGGSGQWAYRLIQEVISSSKAVINRATGNFVISGPENFHIGGNYLNNWEGSFPTTLDQVHVSRAHYRYIDVNLGERGVFDQKRDVPLPTLL